MPSGSARRTDLRMAPAALLALPWPKRMPETILTLAVARAVTPLVGWNLAMRCGAGGAGRISGETMAASRRTGPINIRVITDLE